MLFSFLQQAYLYKKNLKLSTKQIKILQQEKFLKLVRFVSENSPYYQKIIRQNKIDINNCKPEDFPILTKEKLIDEFDNIVTDRQITKTKLTTFFKHSKNPQDLFLNKYYAIHTSGSSGTISYYVYSTKELVQGCVLTTRASSPKLLQKLAYIGATRGHFAGITMVSAAKRLPFLYKTVKTFDINQPFEETITSLNNLQPTIIVGYAFALKKLAEAQKKGELHINPKILHSGGEPLSTEDKKYIQKVFSAPVANVYASSEHLIMGIGKDEFAGMYLIEDNLYFETKPDKTYVTNLFNYTLPLIRYQMSDRLEIIKDNKQIMPFKKIKEIVGRNEYVPTFLNDKNEEDFISPILLVELYIPNMSKFQIHLVDKRSFIFKACLEPNIARLKKEEAINNIEKELKKILKEKLMNKVKYKIEIVDHLWADPKTGKFRLITKA